MYGSTSSPIESPVDSAQSAYQLCDSLRKEITSIGGKVASLDRYYKLLGGDNDTEAMRMKIHNLQRETNPLVTSCVQSLRRLADVPNIGDRTLRIQVEKLRTGFQETVKVYTDLQRKIAVKVKEVKSAPKALPSATNPFADEDPFDLETLEAKKRLQAQLLDQQSTVIAEREANIKALESDILDINQIFQDLSKLVHVQGEAVDNISGNVETAAYQVEEANTQLIQAADYQRKSRKKCILLLIFGAVAIGVIALIIFFSVKH